MMNWFDIDVQLVMLWMWMNLVNVTSASGFIGANPSDTISYVTTPVINDKQGLAIHWLNSTTSSISVTWTFNKKNASDILIGSQVEYFVSGGKFSSHILPTMIRTFTLKNLNADTMYTICATIFIGNQGKQSMQGTKEFTRCVEIWTIPYIRRDSVIILLLTLFYFAFMALMGYSQWRRKVQTIRAKYRRDAIQDDDDSSLQNQPLRWQELEEKERKRNVYVSIEDRE